MTLDRRTLIAGLAVAAPLGGCSVLSSPPPVQLYRFGQSVRTVNPAPVARLTVQYAGTSLPRAAAADRILTTSGSEVSYVAVSRWAVPALVLFEEAIVRAFQGSSVRLVRRPGGARPTATLRLEVRSFEARYVAAGQAPVIVVESRALMTPLGGDLLDQDFSVEQPASADRVSAIAAAFDAATTDVVGRFATWVQATARPLT